MPAVRLNLRELLFYLKSFRYYFRIPFHFVFSMSQAMAHAHSLVSSSDTAHQGLGRGSGGLLVTDTSV